MASVMDRAASAAASPSPRPVFEVEGLHVDYLTEHGVLHAVRDVSLAIHEHESFGLVGESGSGKSTLAMGAIRYLASNGRVTDGSVRLNGVELLGLSRKELRKLWGASIGVVYQSPLSALNPSIPIGRQLAEVARQRAAQLAQSAPPVPPMALAGAALGASPSAPPAPPARRPQGHLRPCGAHCWFFGSFRCRRSGHQGRFAQRGRLGHHAGARTGRGDVGSHSSGCHDARRPGPLYDHHAYGS